MRKLQLQAPTFVRPNRGFNDNNSKNEKRIRDTNQLTNSEIDLQFHTHSIIPIIFD